MVRLMYTIDVIIDSSVVETFAAESVSQIYDHLVEKYPDRVTFKTRTLRDYVSNRSGPFFKITDIRIRSDPKPRSVYDKKYREKVKAIQDEQQKKIEYLEKLLLENNIQTC